MQARVEATGLCLLRQTSCVSATGWSEWRHFDEAISLLVRRRQQSEKDYLGIRRARTRTLQVHLLSVAALRRY